ncbi:MAG: small multi-drug export protein [Candidatus Woesearchaeota archaeon]
MLNEILIIILLTFLPFLELRASIPYGIIVLGKEYWLLVFVIAVAANILLGPILYVFFHKIIHIFLKARVFNNIWENVVERARKRVKPYIEKYGVIGLGIFIGVPLPGSGVYTGAIGGYLLGFNFKDFMKSVVIGVLIAGIVVTIISYFGIAGFEIFLKRLG